MPVGGSQAAQYIANIGQNVVAERRAGEEKLLRDEQIRASQQRRALELKEEERRQRLFGIEEKTAKSVQEAQDLSLKDLIRQGKIAESVQPLREEAALLEAQRLKRESEAAINQMNSAEFAAVGRAVLDLDPQTFDPQSPATNATLDDAERQLGRKFAIDPETGLRQLKFEPDGTLTWKFQDSEVPEHMSPQTFYRIQDAEIRKATGNPIILNKDTAVIWNSRTHAFEKIGTTGVTELYNSWTKNVEKVNANWVKNDLVKKALEATFGIEDGRAQLRFFNVVADTLNDPEDFQFLAIPPEMINQAALDVWDSLGMNALMNQDTATVNEAISRYQVELENHLFNFLDTNNPHLAFNENEDARELARSQGGIQSGTMPLNQVPREQRKALFPQLIKNIQGTEAGIGKGLTGLFQDLAEPSTTGAPGAVVPEEVYQGADDFVQYAADYTRALIKKFTSKDGKLDKKEIDKMNLTPAMKSLLNDELPPALQAVSNLQTKKIEDLTAAELKTEAGKAAEVSARKKEEDLRRKEIKAQKEAIAQQQKILKDLGLNLKDVIRAVQKGRANANK